MHCNFVALLFSLSLQWPLALVWHDYSRDSQLDRTFLWLYCMHVLALLVCMYMQHAISKIMPNKHLYLLQFESNLPSGTCLTKLCLQCCDTSFLPCRKYIHRGASLISCWAYTWRLTWLQYKEPGGTPSGSLYCSHAISPFYIQQWYLWASL